MSQKNVIAHELKELGFKVTLCQSGVIVSLNRPVSTLEVETALAQAFDVLADSFSVKQINSSEVLVEE